MMLAGVVLLAVVALAGGLLWLRRRYLVITVEGTSMSPTYLPGDRLVVRRARAAAVRRGQCVVFAEEPLARGTQWIVKRAAAVPGDPVPRDQVPALSTAAGQRVPPGHLVVLGDNPPHSCDSRHHGYVTADRVLGVVLRPLSGAASGSTVHRADRR